MLAYLSRINSQWLYRSLLKQGGQCRTFKERVKKGLFHDSWRRCRLSHRIDTLIIIRSSALQLIPVESL